MIERADFLRWLSVGFRFLLGGLFVYAGFSKLSDPESLAAVISIYSLLPETLIPVMAIILPLAELTAGILLLADINPGLGGVTLLLILFTGVLVYGIASGLDIDCGCFGPVDPDLGEFGALKKSLIRNIILLGGATYIFIWRVVTGHRPGRIHHTLKCVTAKINTTYPRKMPIDISFFKELMDRSHSTECR